MNHPYTGRLVLNCPLVAGVESDGVMQPEPVGHVVRIAQDFRLRGVFLRPMPFLQYILGGQTRVLAEPVQAGEAGADHDYVEVDVRVRVFRIRGCFTHVWSPFLLDIFSPTLVTVKRHSPCRTMNLPNSGTANEYRPCRFLNTSPCEARLASIWFTWLLLNGLDRPSFDFSTIS